MRSSESLMRDAIRSIKQASDLIGTDQSAVLEYTELKAAAIQAQQASNALFMLVGLSYIESTDKKE